MIRFLIVLKAMLVSDLPSKDESGVCLRFLDLDIMDVMWPKFSIRSYREQDIKHMP